MQQSTVTAISLLFAYLIFTTLKGNLRKYMQVLGIK